MVSGPPLQPRKLPYASLPPEPGPYQLAIARSRYVLLLVVMLAAGGLVAWFSVRNLHARALSGHTTLTLLILLTGIAAAFAPAIRVPLEGALHWLRTMPPARWPWAMAVVGAGSGLVLLLIALHQGRSFGLNWHDDHSYMVAAQMMARGKLWMSQHELADFFENFYLFVKPVYASIYFPGTAIMLLPAAWFGFPPGYMSLLAIALAMAVLWRIIAEMADGAVATVAIVLMLGLRALRQISAQPLSHPFELLFVLLVVWAWLKWRRAFRLRWTIAAGLFTGMAMILRPLDTLCLLLPVVIAVCIDLRHVPTWGRRALHLGLAVALTVPFAAVQFTFNKGVTGDALTLPRDLYVDLEMPGSAFGFHPYDATLRPRSSLIQMQNFHDEWTVPAVRVHQPELLWRAWTEFRLPSTVYATLPQSYLPVLVGVGALGLLAVRRTRDQTTRRPTWLVLAAGALLWLPAHALYAFYMNYYPTMLIPAVTTAAAAAPMAFAALWPRRGREVEAGLVLLLICSTLTALPQINATRSDMEFESHELRYVDEAMASIEGRAVVLFHNEGTTTPHIEPVYNTTAAWPDDARVVRAHDLGERNVELYAYYARTQPDRQVYLYDRTTNTWIRKGTVVEMLAAHESASPPSESPQ